MRVAERPLLGPIGGPVERLFSPNSLLLGFYLRKIELATLTGRAPELCGWALSSSWPRPLNSVNSVAGLCSWALCPGLVLLLFPKQFTVGVLS